MIKIHKPTDQKGKPTLRIRYQHISRLTDGGTGATLKMINGESFDVQETPDEIIKLGLAALGEEQTAGVLE